MERTSGAMLWICLLSVGLSVPLTNAIKCEGKVQRLVAEQMTRSIRSPGFPENYEANDECTYVIQTALPNEDYMLQIATVEFHLNDRKEDCDTDYLEIYEGDRESGTLVEKWCGHEEYVYKARSDTVTLRFKSDDLVEESGFTIFFSVVEFASVQCKEIAGHPITVGTFPLYESFRGSRSMARCEWKIEASDPDKKLLFEIFKASKISCQDAVFNFYEGNVTSGHVSYQYCSTLNPFSKIYLNSHEAMLTFEHAEGAQFDEADDLILKISARSPTYACSSTNHATLEVVKDPVVFPLPYVVDGSGSTCPVTLVTPEESQYIRLDVMGTSEGKATCDSDLIDVTVSRRQEKLMKECNEATSTPVYRQSSSDGVDITLKSDSLVYLRASTVPAICSGVVNKKTAYEDVVSKEHVPSEGGYPNLAHCKYLLSADKLGDMVSLNLTWDNTQDKKDLPHAPGDFIKIYDGDSEAAAVLFSSRGKQELLENKNIVSTQRDMLLVLDSDARITGQSLHIAYFALPGGSYCPSTTQKIMLGRQGQYIMSPNYPDALPLHQNCLYHLVPENPDDDIIVEVVEADLQTECENLLTLYDGEYTNTSTKKMLGRVCGKETPKFRANNDVTLLTTSGDTAGPGGWKIRAYTESSQTDPTDGSNRPSCAISWLLPLVFIILGVFGVL